MNPLHQVPDPLEAELMALRPREISPELRHRVSQRLAQRLAVAPPARRFAGRLALVGGLAAACMIIGLIWWKDARTSKRLPPADLAASASSDDASSALTLLAYRRALSRSPADLDALLDNDGVTTTALPDEPLQICALTRSAAQVRALLGEN